MLEDLILLIDFNLANLFVATNQRYNTKFYVGIGMIFIEIEKIFKKERV
jgi:hypothetical protein